MNAQDYDSAIVDFKKVLDIDPANKPAQAQLALAKQKIKQFYAKQRSIYGGMFEKFADSDARVCCV
jgi:Tfp pilus assembly protein PilF